MMDELAHTGARAEAYGGGRPRQQAGSRYVRLAVWIVLLVTAGALVVDKLAGWLMQRRAIQGFQGKIPSLLAGDFSRVKVWRTQAPYEIYSFRHEERHIPEDARDVMAVVVEGRYLVLLAVAPGRSRLRTLSVHRNGRSLFGATAGEGEEFPRGMWLVPRRDSSEADSLLIDDDFDGIFDRQVPSSRPWKPGRL
jgi:hypothetical protein